MKFCINEMTIMKSGDILSHIAACSLHGIDCMEVCKRSLLQYLREGGTLPALKEAFFDYGVKPVCINAIESISFHEKRSMRVLKEASEYLFYCSKEIGCDCVEVIASFKVPATSTEEINEETAQALRQLSDVAEPYGVKLALEYMGVPGSSVRTFLQAKEIIEAVERDHVGILLDTWHHYAMGSQPDDILQAKASQIFMVHTSDCPERAPGTAVRTESVLPGEGVVPIEEMLKNLNRIGYNGVVSAEIFSPSVQAMPIDMCLETVKQKTQQVMKNSEVLEKQGN